MSILGLVLGVVTGLVVFGGGFLFGVWLVGRAVFSKRFGQWWK